MMLKYAAWAQTDIGLKREINQDSILVDQSLGLFLVADGMGGHKGGEVASAMAIQTAQEVVQQGIQGAGLPEAKKLLVESYHEASSRIHRKSAHENPELMGMGTTMVSALGLKDTLIFANVGDSRAYLYRSPNFLWQLTEDHSLINEQIRAGVISEEDAPNVVGRNVITRSVGFERNVKVDIIERQVQKGDVYILCSDGLSGLVEDEKIAALCNANPPDRLVGKLIKEAKRAGGDDNVSVIVLKPVYR